MNLETLIVDTDKRGVARITLNRPDVRNAFNAKLISELHQTINSLEDDTAVRVIVLRGAGKAFSAGADLTWMKAASEYSIEENEADAMRLSDMLHALDRVPKPVIALVHGAAFGGGVGLTACADIAIATRETIFSLSEVRLGLIPATIAPFVVAAIGQRQARRYFATAERFNGEKALKINLVHETVEDEWELDTVAERIIDEILKGGPLAVSAAKKLIFAVDGKAVDGKDGGKEADEALRRNTAERIAARRASDEGREGIAAFLEKRKPGWWPSDES